ncbi:hypothetical protein [Pasteurella sp. PK-2025]|uniref:hypothetical protein n=1 Tax=unclassified Pasteurella TaxID=2621516 RepID=UPI003C70BB9F
MGFGGILGAIAQGLGTGMKGVADEAWKKEADDRKFKFYADESEKGRLHELDMQEKKFQQEKEMESIKHKNAISLAASRLRDGVGISGGNKDNINQFNDMSLAIEDGMKQIDSINQAIAESGGDKGRIAQLIEQRDRIQQGIDEIKKSDQYYALGNNSGLGERVRIKHNILSGGFMPEKYRPKEPVAEVALLPKVERPKMIDANDKEALEQARRDIDSRTLKEMSKRQIEQYGNNPMLNFYKSYYNR